MAPVIRVNPADSMFDYAHLRITVEGLSPGREVTLVCILTDFNNANQYISFAYYIANAAGDVDCSRDASAGGSYTGIEPVGLLWSLVPARGLKKSTFFMPSDARVPVEYHFYVIDGHQRVDSLVTRVKKAICETTCRRHLLHPDVSRVEVEAGRIRGTLFVPRSATVSNQCFAILDLYGTRGGIYEHRSALLASHGYISLALAYFRYKDLPEALESGLDLDYFEEAVDWLQDQPYVRKEGVAVIGSSLGGDLAILLSTVHRKVKAVVTVNAFHMLLQLWPARRKDRILPIKRGHISSEHFVNETLDTRAFRSSLTDDPLCTYQVEQTDGHFLLICGELDRNTDSVHSGKVLMERLRDHGKEHQGELVVLPGAGHLIEPPYLPHIPLTFTPSYGVFLLLGGETTGHAKAQVAMWNKALEFFGRYLGAPNQIRILGEVITSKL